MEFIQKKKSNKHTFTLHDDYFNFAYEDKSGSGDTDMNYADFPQKSSVQIEQNDWLRNVGYLWIALGIFQLGYAVYNGAPLSGKGFWVLVGSACVLWAYFSKVKYSVFRAERGNVFVIQDKNHDQIIDELNKRRNSQLLQWYGEVNPENELENEIQKFKWLAEQGVITNEEAEYKIAQAELLKKDDFELPGERLN
ncbi:hypothetical protein CWB99_22315 [Pseudoalteromonas rubra]|uniref:SHOCT domain-containing protein n=1 Tax=Pseudoalteromonas rubra TaxID=43658 RepID=A0A5S3WFM3_9GAMM|nr:hypothetical protein [Pseudoalteromonas rubra]TMP24478.1 hypothetical protein CWB99_22315 [Pseudoalteromonas rubra]TMP33281.1 hypothetical protein CWC00_10925 [Pseudoalteromonas rubra]